MIGRALALVAAVACALALAAAPALAGDDRGDGIADAPPAALAKRAAAPQKRLRLPPLDVAALRAEDEAQNGVPGVLAKRWNRVGVVRAIDPVRVPPRPSRWRGAETADDGARAYRVEVDAPGATALRIRFARCALPRGAELWVQDADEPAEIYGPLRLPRDGGGFLAPTVFGERAVVTLRVPFASLDERVRLVVDGVNQRYRPPEEIDPAHEQHAADRAGPSGGESKASLTCMNTVACDAEWFADVSRAVARYEFTDAGSVFLCTGTLLEDADADTTLPWFLTAHHCVNTDKVAKTMEFFWDYKVATCGGPNPILSTVPRTLGATLVTTSGDTDVTLVRITGTLPSNRFFCKWTTDLQPIGTEVVGIHHPEGTHMRISYGDVIDRSPGFITVEWFDGVTSPGSSGSPLFNPAKEVIGQLCCGLSYCSRPHEPDDYGRFDESFANVLSTYLTGAEPPGELDLWDPLDDTPLGATLLGAPVPEGGQHGPHLLEAGDDADWFAVTLTADLDYVLEAGGAVRADLYEDLAGTQLVASDPGLGGTGFQLRFRPAATGDFRLRVTRAQEGEDAAYTLFFSQPIQRPPVAVRRLAAKVSKKRAVTLTWKDVAKDEVGYRVELQGPAGFVELAKLEAGTKRFKHKPGPGEHVYRVGPYNAAGDTMTTITVKVRGRAGLDAWDPVDDNGAGATDLGSDSFGTAPAHELDVHDIADWYRIELTADTTYVFGSLGSGDTVGALFDDAGGTRQLAYNDDVELPAEPPDLNFRFEYTPVVSGTYYVQVKAFPAAPRATYQLYWQVAADQ